MEKLPLVVIPNHNEIETLPEFFKQLSRHWEGHILFVDDGSNDGSVREIKKNKDSRICLIRHEKRMGYGKTLIDGLNFAVQKNYEGAITIDSDLQHDPKHLNAFSQSLREYPVVLGSRYMRYDDFVDVPKERFIINRYVRNFIYRKFNVRFTDPFCGYRAYNSEFLKKINLNEKSYGFAIEILLEVIRTGTEFTEIPVEVIYMDRDRRFLDGLHHAKTRLKYYIDIIFNHEITSKEKREKRRE